MNYFPKKWHKMLRSYEIIPYLCSVLIRNRRDAAELFCIGFFYART